MTAFAEFLQENAEIRTPAGYAAAFGQFSGGECHFGGKRSFVDGTDQCDGAVCPRDPSRQCGRRSSVKRMHFVSFVGMFRADLFEGLCVGHAPRKMCRLRKMVSDHRRTAHKILRRLRAERQARAHLPSSRGIFVDGSSESLPPTIPSRKSIRSGSTRSRSILGAARWTSRLPP